MSEKLHAFDFCLHPDSIKGLDADTAFLLGCEFGAIRILIELNKPFSLQFKSENYYNVKGALEDAPGEWELTNRDDYSFLEYRA